MPANIPSLRAASRIQAPLPPGLHQMIPVVCDDTTGPLSGFPVGRIPGAVRRSHVGSVGCPREARYSA